VDIETILREGVRRQASDIHLKHGSHPIFRVNGTLVRWEEVPQLDRDGMALLTQALLSDFHCKRLADGLQVDAGYGHPDCGRFRVNVFYQRGELQAALRLIPPRVRQIRELNLPPVIERVALERRGLILVTGTTGSGKSTTLASMIDHVNRLQSRHVITVEDPIEYLHQDEVCVITQREIGVDCQSFAAGLRGALRQDPDVILVGEMRDLETISTALTASETGHLVFATLHTQDAPQSIDRIIDVFPAHQQQQVRVQLASALQGICTQQLIPTRDGQGRAIACEVMVATPAIRNLIREGKVHQIYSMLQAGGKYGMVTMDMSLAQLVRSGKFSLEMALERCANEDDLRRLLNG